MQDTKTTGLKKRQLIESASRTVFVWVAVASIAISFCVVAMQFLYQQAAFNNKIIGLKNKAANTLTTNISGAKELQTEVNSLVGNQDLASVKTTPEDSATKVVLDALPGTYNSAALGTSLQQAILSRSGATIESITVPNIAPSTEETTDIKPLPLKFTVVVSGPYDKINNLIKDLERTIRPMQVTSLTATGNDAAMRLTIEGLTYFQPTKGVTIKTEMVR